MSLGWRPLADDAAFAWNSWDVFTGHTPLVGYWISLGPTHASSVTYGLGPVPYWLLSAPVRIDPPQGALWGAALIFVIVIALCIEAAWSVGQWVAAAVGSAAVCMLFITWPDLVLNPVWNPWMGAVLFMAVIATAWATACGRMGWWPVVVALASIDAQCYMAFAAPAIGLAIVSALLGIAVRWRSAATQAGPAIHTPVRSGIRWKWLVVGFGIGVIAWIPPIVQQFTNNPGNLTLLWRLAHRHVASIGFAKALGGLGAAVRPFPEWLHIVPSGSGTGQLNFITQSFGGPKGWAIAVLVILVCVSVIAWITGRYKLSALSVVAIIADLGAVWFVAAFPGTGAMYLDFSYVDVIWWPVGMLTWVVLIWTLVELLRQAVRLVRGVDWLGRLWGHVWRVASVCALAAIVGIGIVVYSTNLSHTNTETQSGLGNWSTVRTSEQATAAVRRVAPPGPFALRLDYKSTAQFSVLLSSAYSLYTQGYEPRMGPLPARYFGLWTAAKPSLPTVTIELSGSQDHPRVSASLQHASSS